MGAKTTVAIVNIIKEAKKNTTPLNESIPPEKILPIPKIIYRINSATIAIIPTKNIIILVPNFILQLYNCDSIYIIYGCIIVWKEQLKELEWNLKEIF